MKKLYSTSFILFVALTLFSISLSAQTQTVTLGTGTAISVFSPLNRTNDYCVYEVIYLASDINVQGDIVALGFQRHDGTNTDSIENVSIFLKHTSQSQVFTGTIDTTGYQLVFNGSFPNDSGAGWREVIFDTPFSYDNINNLQVLVLKGYQQAIANTPVTPRWIYTNISGSPRARRYYGANPINLSTSLSTTNFISNAILTFLTTGLESAGETKIQLYPNPTRENLHVTLPQHETGAKITVMDITGSVVIEKEIETEQPLSLQWLDKGTYLVRIVGKNNRIILQSKLVVID